MRLQFSERVGLSCCTSVPTSILAGFLAISVSAPIQASAPSSTDQQKRIEALEKRVRILERLLTEQHKAATYTSSGSKKHGSVKAYKTIRTMHKPKEQKPKAIIASAPASTAAEHSFAKDKKIHLKGVTITPGGFFAGEGFFRSRYEQSDIGSSFSGIPLGNNPLHYMRETRLSARQSRFSSLVEGAVNPDTLLSGFIEADFLGNGSANSNESNSFDLRLRHAYANTDWNNWGFHVLAGQTWTLATTNFKGITPRNEIPPPTIDAQYVVGFVWKRQPQLRLVKNLGRLFTAAVSVENPQTTFGGTPCGTVLGNGVINQVCSALGIQTLPNVTFFSLNNIPDVIGKLAYEQTLSNHRVHIEGYGLYRNFYDRVRHTPDFNENHNTVGYGIGGGGLIEVIPKFLDLQGNILAGHGIGSYVSGLLPDATISSNGALAAIPEVAFMVGATLHATPNLDFYVFGGQEKEERRYFSDGQNYFGYGVPNANNTGCTTEYGICDGNNQALWQVTTGLWNKFYQGDYGDLRAGLQYSYTERRLFSGNGGLTNINPPRELGYHTNDQMVFASLRYYPFTIPAVSSAATK